MSTSKRKAAVFRISLFRPSETFIADQALSVAGFEVRLIGRETESTAPTTDIAYRVPVAPNRWQRVRQLAVGADGFYRQALEEWKPEVVHAHFGVDAVAVMRVAESLRLPLVTTFHGYDATTRLSRLLRSGSPTLVRYAVGRSQLARTGRTFICVSDFIRSRVLALGFPEERVVKHYIGTDLSRFAGFERTFSNQAPVVLHVARLVEKKGTFDLLRAFKGVVDRIPDAQLVIVGEGPLKGPLEQFAAEQLPAQAVRFLGARPHAEVVDQLKRAAVFCLPSVTAANGDTEGLPISIIEAAAAALPVVATFHSGIPEAVKDGEGGLLVQERDVPALADSLIQLLLDGRLARRLAESARSYVHDNFDLCKQGVKLGRIYADAAA